MAKAVMNPEAAVVLIIVCQVGKCCPYDWRNWPCDHGSSLVSGKGRGGWEVALSAPHNEWPPINYSKLVRQLLCDCVLAHQHSKMKRQYFIISNFKNTRTSVTCKPTWSFSEAAEVWSARWEHEEHHSYGNTDTCISHIATTGQGKYIAKTKHFLCKMTKKNNLNSRKNYLEK